MQKVSPPFHLTAYISAMRQLQPVLWTKGTLLTPQCLQAQDRYLETVQRFRWDSVTYCPWGFADVQIDRTALTAGILQLSSAVGLLPDGMPFDMPSSDPLPPARTLGELPWNAGETLDVMLAVPQHRSQGINVHLTDRFSTTRYFAEPAQIRDEVSGTTDRPVAFGRKNFRLFLEGENTQGFSMLRLGRVRKTEAGTFETEEGFIPPLLTVEASQPLMALTKGVLEMLSARSGELSGTRRQRNLSLADFTSVDIAGFWLLYTINSWLPEVRHFYEVRRGHPEPLFRLLIGLAGALTSFSTELRPSDLPVYNHNDLAASFYDLELKLRQLLGTVVPKNFVALQMKLVEPFTYAAALTDDRYFSGARLYLSVRTDSDHAQLIQRGPGLIKVSAANRVSQLVQRALPGLDLIHTPRPPAALPRKSDCEYFLISQSGQNWESILRARNIAAFVPDDFRGPELELLILLPETIT